MDIGHPGLGFVSGLGFGLDFFVILTHTVLGLFPHLEQVNHDADLFYNGLCDEDFAFCSDIAQR